jgi:hypothetical protein
MACKGICIRHRAPKPFGSGRYFSGHIRCQVCNIFIIWKELWCPCCEYRLRTKPRNSVSKERFTIRTKKKQIRKRGEGEETKTSLVVRY